MSRLPKREKLDLVQASAAGFAEAGTGKSVVLAHVAMKFKADECRSGKML